VNRPSALKIDAPTPVSHPPHFLPYGQKTGSPRRAQRQINFNRKFQRQKVNCRKAAREAALGRVRDKKTPLTPQTCAPTARALPRRAIQNQKGGFRRLF
jgi:hypothetical protein